MSDRATRETVDLSAYPDLVVIYLGMRVKSPRGLVYFLRLGKEIRDSVNANPDGLLLHEQIVYGLNHGGMRQYWRDLGSLEAWTRTLPHQKWWREFLRDRRGTGFWHELYTLRGGMEAMYVDMPGQLGLKAFAPTEPARGRLFGARGRLAREGAAPDPVLAEEELV